MTATDLVPHPAFDHRRSRRIETLNLTMHEFEHRATGAMHFHLDAPNAENVFMVALRTVPMDSTGVAHILEHTALCGSERYPVRDPFFWMIRRSLNTFMNAFTTNDYTAYPFASLNRKDYFNLLDVYLDSVFFSKLEELDFAQEGYRVEFERPDDVTSDLVYRGVVYNEMKGDSSSPVSMLYESLNKELYPTTTYHYNSGGDPAHIPDLAYDQLLAFYRTHYHPSNAVFMTFGDIPAEEQQAVMEERALERFERLPARIEVGREQRFTAPRTASANYGIEPGEGTRAKTHLVLGWLLGDNTDLELVLRLNLLSDALLDTAASPLRHALESSRFAGALSPLCGLEESSREMSFVCGIEGTEPEHAEAIEELVLDTLRQVAIDGIAQDRLEACLHQLELSQREIGGDGAPFGLQLIFSCMSAAIHRGDPIDLLDLDPVLEKLRADIRQPGFIQALVRTHLLDNPHRVRLTMAPDPEYANRVKMLERERLDRIKASLTDEQAQVLVERAAALERRQAASDDVSVLPRVGIEDIGVARSIPVPAHSTMLGAARLRHFEAGTNGLVYHQLASPIPSMTPDLLGVLPLFSSVLAEIGSGGEGYLDTQHLQHSVTGGISAWAGFRGSRAEPDDYAAWFTLSSRTLGREGKAMIDLVKRTIDSPNFTERVRLRDLVRQLALRRTNSITGNGHALAMSAASAVFRRVPRLQFRLSGLAGIAALKALDEDLDRDDAMDALVDRLTAIARLIAESGKELLVVTDPLVAEDTVSAIESVWRGFEAGSHPGINADVEAPARDQAWLTSTQVNFCAQAFPTVPEDHADNAPLSILAGVLRNGFLHGQLREKGGAYGGGASHDGANGVFRFYSYRDPNLMQTFEVFDQAVDWINETNIDFDLVEEAILGLVAGIDAPSSPAGEARQAFQNSLFGRDAEHRDRLRERLLAVGVDDVKRVASDYLRGEPARATVTNDETAERLPDSFLVSRIQDQGRR